jgi:hypothetical protein
LRWHIWRYLCNYFPWIIWFPGRRWRNRHWPNWLRRWRKLWWLRKRRRWYRFWVWTCIRQWCQHLDSLAMGRWNWQRLPGGWVLCLCNSTGCRRCWVLLLWHRGRCIQWCFKHFKRLVCFRNPSLCANLISIPWS